MSLDRAATTAVAEAALAAAESSGRRVSVAVVDAHGRDLVVLRGDGAAWFTPAVARAKAATAAAMSAPSADLAGLQAAYPGLVELIDAQLAAPMTTLPGGVPLAMAGALVGAVGVSGADPAEDVAYAAVGAAALQDDATRP